MKHILKTILLAVVFLFVFSTAKATTVSDILKQIAALQQQIAQLQAQLATLQPVGQQTQNTQQKITGLEKLPASFVFQKDLKTEDANDDVAFAQRILKSEGLFCAKCYVTGYFGLGTKQALILFQKKYQLNVTGVVDSSTRVKMNQILQASRGSSQAAVPVVPTATPAPTPVAPVPLQSFPNASPGTTSVTPSVNDTSPPSFSITINGGAQLTTNSEVTIQVNCKDPSGGEAVRFSNVSAFVNEPWGGIAIGKQWVLSSGDGVKTVYAQCEDAAGNIATASNTITLNALPPLISGISPAGTLATNTKQVTLSLVTNEQATCRYSATQGVDYDAIYDGNTFTTTNFGTSHSITVSTLTAGSYVFYIRCKDTVGNKNTIDTAIRFSQPSAPSASGSISASILINNGATITNVANVVLTLTCSAADGVQDARYTNMPAFSAEPFEAFSSTKQWALSDGSGSKTVLYQCRDAQGHTTTSSNSITLDITPPVRSNSQPSAALSAGTTQTTLSLSTDEPATCKYSTAPGIAYDNMANTFSTTLGTSHATSITGLLNGGQYAYYVKCSDSLANKNLDDFSIGFRVQNPTYAMNVLVLKYFPLTADGKNIDISVTGDIGDLYTIILQRTIDVTNNLKTALQKASTYLGYKDASAQPSLNYTVVDTKTTNSAVPTKNTPVLRYPDYFQILSDLKICDYVTQQNVNEVWLFAYQGPTQADGAPYLNIAESKMAGPNGDISNSYRYNNMPTCSKTYRVYTFNYGRGTAEAMESWGHQMEAELDAVNSTLFRNAFQGVNYPQTLSVPGRCGSVHNPPNARSEYDRANPIPQQSDCLDWNPDTLGPTSAISCQNWGCQDVSDSNNASLNYMIWNWQNLPGASNAKIYQAKHLRNWWDVHGDFDNVLANNKRLTIEP